MQLYCTGIDCCTLPHKEYNAPSTYRETNVWYNIIRSLKNINFQCCTSLDYLIISHNINL